MSELFSTFALLGDDASVSISGNLSDFTLLYDDKDLTPQILNLRLKDPAAYVLDQYPNYRESIENLIDVLSNSANEGKVKTALRNVLKELKEGKAEA